MKKMLKRLAILALLCLVMTSMAFGNSGKTGQEDGLKKLTIFLGRPNEDYPNEGTILGNWIEQKTGVRLEWEFPVGDLKQKIGLVIASGDYPDLIDGRNENQSLYDNGVFIPLDDLIEQYGPNIKRLYGDKIDMLRKNDGHIYWFPQLFPYGEKVQRTQETHGFYIQNAVLKEFGYPMPKNVEEAFDLLAKYAAKHPEINGKKTYAFTALAWSWREFPLMNAPSILSGHPNDGVCSVDWVNGKWVATQFYNTKEAYKIYKIYNDVFLKGLYDTESFVMDYDQYLAKLSTGSILAFYDQYWQFQQVQILLRDQGGERIFVPLPLVMDGYSEEFEGPLEPQTSEGVGITVDCKDPVTAIKYLDFLCSEEANLTRQWGFKGTDYLVGEDGLYYRTPEMINKWLDQKWANKVFGQKYWIEMCGWSHASMYSDGINPVSPAYQPSIFQQNLKPAQKAVLEAYGKASWYDFFKQPDMRRAKYFPMWTAKIPTGSDVEIAKNKIDDTRRKWTPRLIMADAGKYDEIWKQYLAELEKIPNREKVAKFYQDELDKRIDAAGGY